MFRRWIIGSIAALMLAGLAQAQDAGRVQLERPGAADLGLRGAGLGGGAPADPGAADPAAPEGLVLRPMAAPGLSTLGLDAPRSAAQCRTTCAQDYYFCLASEESDECPQGWGQCRLACGQS